jgi:DNA polymerase-3 subunit beta
MTIAAAEGILIQAQMPDTCVLTTYDLEKGVQITMKGDVQVLEEGEAILNASKFGQIVRAMEGGDIVISVDSKLCATISCGTSSQTMMALPAKDFPELPRLSSPHGFVISQKVFKETMSKCMYAMGVNDQRPVFNGLYLNISDGHMDMVSCDSIKIAVCGVRAAMQNLNTTGEELHLQFIVPNKAVNELYKLLDDGEESTACIYMSRKNVIVVLGNTVFFSKLIEGAYPDYNRVIIRNHKITVLVDRVCLIGALERAALITEEKVAGAVRPHVRLQVEGNVLKVTATSGTGSSYDELAVAHTGEDLTIAFNNRYLMDSLRACRSDMVRISMSSAMTSINIEPADPETDENGEVVCQDLFFLLPVRTKE